MNFGFEVFHHFVAADGFGVVDGAVGAAVAYKAAGFEIVEHVAVLGDVVNLIVGVLVSAETVANAGVGKSVGGFFPVVVNEKADDFVFHGEVRNEVRMAQSEDAAIVFDVVLKAFHGPFQTFVGDVSAGGFVPAAVCDFRGGCFAFFDAIREVGVVVSAVGVEGKNGHIFDSCDVA